MEGQVIENAVQETVQETVDKVNSNWDKTKAYFNGHIPDLISFGMKVVLSIVAFYVGTKLIKWLLAHCEMATYSAILGFVIGSVFSIFPGWSEFFTVGAIVAFLVGVACIALCNHYSAE